MFPWGTQWRPPRGAGNYGVESVDDLRNTSPVGSFAANQLGLFDLGGNVWEWCEDELKAGSGTRVLRDGSWGNGGRGILLSSPRGYIDPGRRGSDSGFRCVLVVAGG